MRYPAAIRAASAVLFAIGAAMFWPASSLAIPPQRLSPGPVLTGSDANDLASSLADASSVQGVCYGWRINVDDSSGGASGVDEGSSKDPTSVTPALQCPRYVVLTGNVDYVSDSSESDDSASYTITSNLANPPSVQDLDNLGVGSGGMLNNDNDTALINSVQALPLIVSDKGEARRVRADLTPKPPGSPDHPTGTGSDSIHPNAGLLGIGGLLLLGGLIWLWREIKRAGRSRPRRTAGPGAPEPEAP